MRTMGLAGAALTLLVSAPAIASNTGFSLRVELLGQETSCTNLVSTPYFYFPNGDVSGPQFAHDLTLDFPTATSFARIDPVTGKVERWQSGPSGWSGVDFPLEAALGISVTVPSATEEQVVGSHDDSFPGLLLRAAGPVTTHLVAPPYHSTWDSADDLLDGLFDGGNRLVVATFRGGALIQRWIEPDGSRGGTSFDLVPQEALLLTVEADTLFLSPHYFTEGTVEIAPPERVSRSQSVRLAPRGPAGLCPEPLRRSVISLPRSEGALEVEVPAGAGR